MEGGWFVRASLGKGCVNVHSMSVWDKGNKESRRKPWETACGQGHTQQLIHARGLCVDMYMHDTPTYYRHYGHRDVH